jgi:hypothetical protein
MRAKTVLFRIFLSVMLCLNGSTALWASTSMALDPAHMAPASDPDGHDDDHGRADAACDADAPECTAAADLAQIGDRHPHASGDCRCGAGMLAGCSCECAYPAGANVVSVPFAAGGGRGGARPRGGAGGGGG